MKKIVLEHPIHEVDMEVFVGKVEEENRYIISIPSESFSIEMREGKIDWGYTNQFGNSDGRIYFEEQLKKQL